MTKSQSIFAASAGATTLGTGSWLLTIDPSGLGLVLAGTLILASNGYTWLQRGLAPISNRLPGKSHFSTQR